MKRISFFLIIILILSTQNSQADNVYMLGHSLINFHLPRIFDELAADANVSHNYGVQVGIGAPLSWNWTNPSSAQGDLYTDALPTGNYDAFIMTEAIPLLNHTTWSDTDVYLANFSNYAKSYNPNTQVYLFETWHCTDSGTPTGCDWDDNDDILWRDRLDLDLSIWEGLVNDHNANNSDNMLIVPGGQALALLYDNIAAGNTPDLVAITDVFDDNIHMNDIGNYYMACVYFATVYGQSPVGLTNQTYGEFGTPYNAPSPALATHLQQLAWQTVTTYPLSGVSPTSQVHLESTDIEIFPNPTNDIFTITGNITNYQIQILDVNGAVHQTLTGTNVINIDINNLPTGIYFISIEQNGNPVCSVQKILKM